MVKYDVVNNQHDPELLGSSAGLYEDDSIAYVGYGNNLACNSNIMPGRVTINPLNPGIYMPCGVDIFDSANVYYMLDHNDLQWQSTDNEAIKSIVGVLRVFDSMGQSYLYSRNIINSYTQLGKISNGFDVNTCYFTEGGIEVNTITNFDVLLCNPPTCGSFVKFDAKVNFNEPESKGFVGGSFINGENSYVGFGYNSGLNCLDFPSPGRISTDPVRKGTYLPCGGDNLDLEKGLYDFL